MPSKIEYVGHGMKGAITAHRMFDAETLDLDPHYAPRKVTWGESIDSISLHSWVGKRIGLTAAPSGRAANYQTIALKQESSWSEILPTYTH